MLPKNAPDGGIEPCLINHTQKFEYFFRVSKQYVLIKLIKLKANCVFFSLLLAHDAIFFVGKSSGSFSLIDGTAGAE